METSASWSQNTTVNLEKEAKTKIVISFFLFKCQAVNKAEKIFTNQKFYEKICSKPEETSILRYEQWEGTAWVHSSLPSDHRKEKISVCAGGYRSLRCQGCSHALCITDTVAQCFFFKKKNIITKSDKINHVESQNMNICLRSEMTLKHVRSFL